MIKINFTLENRYNFKSALLSGNFINLCLYYFDDIFVNKEVRQDTMNYIKSQISLLCFYINKSHKMYRMKQKEDSIKLPGGLTVLPQTDIRIILCTTLFYFVRTDDETMWSILTNIHDSTYHLLFVFAMEKCHNNIYLAKFLDFLRIFFEYATESTILNAIIKVNQLSDLSKFLMNYVHREDIPKPYNLNFMFFFRELAELIEKASKRNDCTRLKNELKSSLNWLMYKELLKENIKDVSSLLCDPKVFMWK